MLLNASQFDKFLSVYPEDDSMFTEIGNVARVMIGGVYIIVLPLVVIGAVLGIMIAILMWSYGNAEKRKEGKNGIIRAALITFILFSGGVAWALSSLSTLF